MYYDHDNKYADTGYTFVTAVRPGEEIIRVMIRPVVIWDPRFAIMPNTYSQINIQAVFAVRSREGLIAASWRSDLFQYMAGILRHEAGYPLAVGGWRDHVHVFFEQKSSQSTADVVRVLKCNSSKWVNDQGLLPVKFAWQEGYGAFSYARRQRDVVIRYIMNQEQHHARKTFRQEYLSLLDEFEIPFVDRYLFDFFE